MGIYDELLLLQQINPIIPRSLHAGEKKMGLSGKGGILCQVGLGIPGPWIILQSSILKPLAAGSVFFGVQSSFLLSRNKLKLK